MAIYTKRGDKGETSLIGQNNINKSEPIFECLGTLDEANALIALLASYWPKNSLSRIIQWSKIQADLLLIGSWLASQGKNEVQLETLTKRVQKMEEIIDQQEERLPRLNNFVLPGQTQVVATAHLARAVIRRAERQYYRQQYRNDSISQYINRLSDYIYICARVATYDSGEKENIWRPT